MPREPGVFDQDTRAELIGRLGAVVDAEIAPRAAEYDRRAAHPRESWQALARSGFLGLSVPAAYGGLGLDPVSYCAAIERIAIGCSSTAMTVHMHSTVMRFIDALARPDQKTRFYRRVVEDGELFGSWGSEPPVSLTRRFLVQTAIREVPDGYAISGLKHFCTMAGGAGHYMVWCALEGRGKMSRSLLLALVARGNPGYQIVGDWDPLGMRATVSPPVRFTDCRIGPDDVLGEPGRALHCGVIEGFALGYAAVYLGTATGAYQFALDYCRTKTFEPDPQPIGADPEIQRHLAQMAVALAGARVIIRQSAAAWGGASTKARGRLAAEAKYAATEAALMVTSRVLQVCGGRSAMRNLPVERAFRDVRTATLMPPNVDTMLATIGKDELGFAEDAFRFG